MNLKATEILEYKKTCHTPITNSINTQPKPAEALSLYNASNSPDVSCNFPLSLRTKPLIDTFPQVLGSEMVFKFQLKIEESIEI